LKKADWKHLTQLNLCIYYIDPGKNNIEDKGCRHLREANWQKLTNLNVCIIYNNPG